VIYIYLSDNLYEQNKERMYKLSEMQFNHLMEVIDGEKKQAVIMAHQGLRY
jgi:hypothetical protein